MSFESRFTREDTEALLRLPMRAESLTVVSDMSGYIGRLKELLATATTAYGGKVDYPNNQLIQYLINLAKSPEVKKQRDQLKWETYNAAYNLEEIQLVKQDFFRIEVQIVNRILHSKVDPNEALEYKQWVSTIAFRTALAAKDGGFLGIGRKKISDKEQAVLNMINSTLGI